MAAPPGFLYHASEDETGHKERGDDGGEVKPNVVELVHGKRLCFSGGQVGPGKEGEDNGKDHQRDNEIQKELWNGESEAIFCGIKKGEGDQAKDGGPGVFGGFRLPFLFLFKQELEVPFVDGIPLLIGEALPTGGVAPADAGVIDGFFLLGILKMLDGVEHSAPLISAEILRH